MYSMKKIFFLLNFFLAANLFSAAPYKLGENFAQFVLQNGMNVFVMEDFSSPTVRVEYTAKAGFSAQSALNSGFAPLYASLFKNAGIYSAKADAQWLPSFMESECNADSARFYTELLPEELATLFEQLSYSAFAPLFPDSALESELSAVKDSVKENALSIEGFINSAIDSRVFSAAPWKHDSGVYPALFSEQTLSSARVILQEFGRRFYSPQNSALFICGAVKKEAALSLAERTFGKFMPSAKSAEASETMEKGAGQGGSAQKKFVLSDPELSPDMAQAVAQWTGLGMEEADIAALILNSRNSALKISLTKEDALAILGSDYVNADAAHKNSSDRLIIQTLMEKSALNFFEQSALFESLLLSGAANFTTQEFDGAKKFLIENFESSISTSRGFMDLLSQFWAVDGLKNSALSGSGEQGDAESLVQRFLSRPEKIRAVRAEELLFKLQNERPFIFILLNSKAFAPLKSDFAGAGFESVTAKNASWYSQELFSNIRDSLAQKNHGDSKDEEENFLNENIFLKENSNNVFSRTLKNKIPVTVRVQKEGLKSAVSLYIKGGRLFDYHGGRKLPGIESVTIDALAYNIQKAADERYAAGKLCSIPSVTNSTRDTSSLITIECALPDAALMAECIGEALVFTGIRPAELDAFISSRRSGEIIRCGSLQSQLYSAAVQSFYKDSKVKMLYSSDGKFLEGISYNEILENYMRLLDAGRLALIACGNFSSDSEIDEFVFAADKILGNLNSSFKEKEDFSDLADLTSLTNMTNTRLPSRTAQRVRLTHKFLTDISGDKAGPRPAVLIPTTDFSDPVQYWIPCPAAFSEDKCIFDALLTELAAECRKIIGENERFGKMSCRIEQGSPLISFGTLTLFNVRYTSDADSILQSAIANIESRAFDADSVRRIKNEWIKARYGASWQSREAAALIAEKADALRLSGELLSEKSAQGGAAENLFISDYERVHNASHGDFERVFSEYFSGRIYKFYSADGKK